MNVLEFVAWPCMFISGMSLGFVIGVRYQHRKLTREVAVQTQDIKTWYRHRWPALVGAFCIVMAFLTYSSQKNSGDAVDEVRQQSRCLTTYANRLYESLQPRQAASEALQDADHEFNDALVSFLKDALAKNPDRAKVHDDVVRLSQAAGNKQRVAAHLSSERADNPYPSPPKAVCPQ